MMAEYIEREALVDVLTVSHAHHANNSREASLLDRDIRLIWEQPAADVAPVVHGRWINVPPYHGAYGQHLKAQECSVCHAFYVSDANKPYSNHKYCAECGARMDGA